MPHIEGHVDEVGLRPEVRAHVPSDHECHGAALRSPIRLPWFHTMPTDIGISATLGVEPGEVLRAVQLAVTAAEVSHQGDEALQPGGGSTLLFGSPIEPIPLLVMAVGIVVTFLRATQLISHREHRYALAQEEQRHRIALESRAQ